MIFRRHHTANFTTISNVLLDDDRLAADEVGILAYLLSRPHDWEVRRPALMRRWGIGIVAMKRIVHSWMRTGWCHATKVRLRNGQFYILYEIRDLPGQELSDDEIREALSLVSSEALADDAIITPADHQPYVTSEPPPCQPLLDGQGVVTEGWPIKDIPTNELPRDESYQKLERERAREKEKHALNLADFKRRWPTASSDDQALIDGAWFELSLEEGEAALGNIARFLEKQKRDGRTKICAGQTYLRQKRWTLLDQPDAAANTAVSTVYALDSAEAKAIRLLHELVGRTSAFFSIWRRPNGVCFSKPMTPQLAALALAPPPDQWASLSHQQAGAWEGMFRSLFDDGIIRTRLREGARAPWQWPPKNDGSLYTSATGPPSLMSEQDAEDFK